MIPSPILVAERTGAFGLKLCDATRGNASTHPTVPFVLGDCGGMNNGKR